MGQQTTTSEPGSSAGLGVLLRFVDTATDALGAAREEVDALNVYPVPDGDTGTNMFLTVSAARDALRDAVDGGADRVAALRIFSRAALMGARGNSGVILSQMLGALSDNLAESGSPRRNAEVVAAAFVEAADASYAAVGTPVEGTILSVARAAADSAAETAARPGTRTREVITAAAAAARSALARTPDQLQVLADAGVVDAGGRGLCVLLDAAESVITGKRMDAAGRPIPTPILTPGADLTAEGPAYEVMYLLDAATAAIGPLRATLAGLGDSLVVVGGDGLWNVHVHVDDVGAAIEAGIVAGRPHRIRVTHFAEQIADAHVGAGRDGRGIVAVAAGPGLRALFEAAGAVVVDGGPGARPSTGMLLDAIRSAGTREIVLLPNDPDSVRVAEIAARTAESDLGLRVAVIATQAQVQGLAALAVHEPGRSFDADVLEMTATARHARHGAVTVAARAAFTMAGPCVAGDALGVIDGDFAIVGPELLGVATEVIARLLGAGGDLLTLVSGADGRDLAVACATWAEESHPHADVVVYDGGQERYPLLISVE